MDRNLLNLCICEMDKTEKLLGGEVKCQNSSFLETMIQHDQIQKKRPVITILNGVLLPPQCLVLNWRFNAEHLTVLHRAYPMNSLLMSMKTIFLAPSNILTCGLLKQGLLLIWGPYFKCEFLLTFQISLLGACFLGPRCL